MASKTARKQGRGFKEFVRKFFVSLKRTPSTIPLVASVVAFVWYSLNLASISNTTCKINTTNMGQCEFVTMLLSILMMVVFLRCFPKREKPKYIMIGLYYLMAVAQIFCDIVYITRINKVINSADNPFDVNGADSYILKAQSVMTVHIIILIICAALVALLPIYGRLLKKINTSIDVEGNEDMNAIDLTSDAE